MRSVGRGKPAALRGIIPNVSLPTSFELANPLLGTEALIAKGEKTGRTWVRFSSMLEGDWLHKGGSHLRTASGRLGFYPPPPNAPQGVQDPAAHLLGGVIFITAFSSADLLQPEIFLKNLVTWGEGLGQASFQEIAHPPHPGHPIAQGTPPLRGW